MELFITAFYILFGGFCLMYVILIGWFTYGWFSMVEYFPLREKYKTKLSVVIPSRNEERNIVNCLNDLIKQDYPKELFEIIIIDDDSTDKTANIVNDFINNNPEKEITLISSKNSKIPFQGKKQAIKTAVSVSKGDFIITTDADCRMREKWLSTIAAYFESQKIKMIILNGIRDGKFSLDVTNKKSIPHGRSAKQLDPLKCVKDEIMRLDKRPRGGRKQTDTLYRRG